MKTNFTTFGTLALVAMAFVSCETSDDADTLEAVPTASEFRAIQDDALENITQHFEFEAEDGFISLTSEKGVIINIPAGCLTLNGNPVTGTVDLEFAEIFDGGTMVVTNKPTMGVLPNGDLALLISGGEFYVNATQNGQQLDITCNMSLLVPTVLTDGLDNDMTLWNGRIGEDGELNWKENDGPAGDQGGVFGEGNNYYVSFGDFGWTNVDRFYSDPRPKTTILVDVPTGYDNENSSVYLSYDGEGSALARLDTFTEEGLFSEHYGQIPVGLECHVIFVTEEDGQFRYAIKGVTIAADDVITFTSGETVTGSEEDLVAAINAVQ